MPKSAKNEAVAKFFEELLNGASGKEENKNNEGKRFNKEKES